MCLASKEEKQVSIKYTGALSTSLRFIKIDFVEKVSFILELTSIIKNIKDTPLLRSLSGVFTYTLVI